MWPFERKQEPELNPDVLEALGGRVDALRAQLRALADQVDELERSNQATDSDVAGLAMQFRKLTGRVTGALRGQTDAQEPSEGTEARRPTRRFIGMRGQ